MQLELKRLHRELRKTFVYVTHDQEEALGLSDRVAVLLDGQLLQLATPEVMYAQPNSVAVARFIGTANVITGTLQATADRGACVELPGGARITLGTSPARQAGGGAVTIMIRAEHMRVTARSGQPAAGLPARVCERLFLGDKIRYELELGAAGARLTALEAGERERFAVGDEVQVTADPANITVIACGEEAAGKLA
jgi:ABC-type Fe3+/spermidine/putrescine transport system ATPase subunit